MTGNCELFNRSSSTRHILLEDFNLDHKEVKIDVINNTNDDNYELEKKLCKEYESKNGKKYNVVYF